MVPDPPTFDLWRVAGAVIGTLLAFLISWPTSWRDFWTRLGTSIICGVIIGPLMDDYFKWPDFPKFALASSMLSALFSWAAIGMVMRIIGTTTKLPTSKPEKD